MPSPKITLYMDIVSPFAYLAFHVLRHSSTFAKCNVKYVPIFLGGLMKTCGNNPPINIKNKDKWINEERRRWAEYFSVPMPKNMPEGFPPLTLGNQRVLCVVSQKSPGKLVPVMEAFYHSLWVDGNAKIGQPEEFTPILEGVLGKSGAQEILQAANQAEAKSLLSSNTEQAYRSGAFGLPWFECTNLKGETQSFWGIDHLGQVADFLGLDRTDKGFRAML